MKKSFIFVTLFVILLFLIPSFFLACSNNSDNSNSSVTDENEGSKTESSSESLAPAIIGKWYFNSEDDRYYYNFLSDGTIIYSYYQHAIGDLSGFVTKNGSWKYLNEEKTMFSVSWDDSIACWYDIVIGDSEKLVVRANGAGPVGRGLDGMIRLKAL